MTHVQAAAHALDSRRRTRLGTHVGHLAGLAVWPALGYLTVIRGLGWWVALAAFVETAIGRSRWDPDEEWRATWGASKAYRAVAVLWAPLLVAALAAALALTAEIHRILGWSPRGVFVIAGITLALGLMRGIVANIVAHELMHRGSRLEWVLAELLMTTSTYTHFCIEHVYGHHARLATPDDPATARYGESLYRFFLRSVPGSVASAWDIEVRRLRRRGHPVWSRHNRMLRYGVEIVLMYGAAAAWWGMVGVVVLAGQSVLSFLALETANYIEHYGLVRAKLPDGRWERVAPWHSWDTSSRVTNALLLAVGRHADHHLNARHPYQSLGLHPDAPQLPFGYFGMVQLALVPPLWFRTMNHRIPPRSRDAAVAANAS